MDFKTLVFSLLLTGCASALPTDSAREIVLEPGACMIVVSDTAPHSRVRVDCGSSIDGEFQETVTQKQADKINADATADVTTSTDVKTPLP